jgi:hypothetical protein
VWHAAHKAAQSSTLLISLSHAPTDVVYSARILYIRPSCWSRRPRPSYKLPLLLFLWFLLFANSFSVRLCLVRKQTLNCGMREAACGLRSCMRPVAVAAADEKECFVAVGCFSSSYCTWSNERAEQARNKRHKNKQKCTHPKRNKKKGGGEKRGVI